MSILTVCLYAVIFIVALLLIVLILIQPSKSGGMGAAFGGIGESVFGGKAGSHLTKGTVIMTTIFFVAALTLAAVIGHEGAGKDEELRKALVTAEEPASNSADAETAPAAEKSEAQAVEVKDDASSAEKKDETKAADKKNDSTVDAEKPTAQK